MWLLILGVVAAAAAGLWWTSRPPGNTTATRNGTSFATNAVALDPAKIFAAAERDTNVQNMEVASSVMVTDVLDFGDHVPTPAEALQHVERLYKPADGSGRTFSILEAFGFTNDTGKLQMSMRISSEEPGLAAIVFKPTGKVLWQTRVTPKQGPPPPEKQLTVMMDEEEGGKQLVVDGSKNPSFILDAAIHQSPMKMRDHWPNGAERTLTFIYSACGCPVKAKVRRVGDKTMRTSDWPVLFPDDPDAMRVINSLMGWM
jgi:hypothetical protein